MWLLEKPSCLVGRKQIQKIKLTVTFVHCSIFLSVNFWGFLGFWFCGGFFGCFFTFLVTLILLELLDSLMNETLCWCSWMNSIPSKSNWQALEAREMLWFGFLCSPAIKILLIFYSRSMRVVWELLSYVWFLLWYKCFCTQIHWNIRTMKRTGVDSIYSYINKVNIVYNMLS